MSVTYRLLDSQLKLPDVFNKFKAIGVEAEYKGEDDDGEKTYVIGNDTYGYTRMYLKKDIVTEFHRFGLDGVKPIGMLFQCFGGFMAIDTNDYSKDGFCDDLDNLPPREFFAKHYPKEYEIYEIEQRRAKEFAEDHPELNSYIESNGRTLNSYRFEYAYHKNLPVEEVTDVDEVINFIYRRAQKDEELDDMLRKVRERQAKEVK